MSSELVPVSSIPARPPAVPEPADDLIDAWLAGKSPTTIAAYRADLRDYARARGLPSPALAVEQLLACRPGEANATVLSYRNSLLERGLATATVARRLAALRSVVDLARLLGRVAWSIEVPAPRVEARRDTRGPDAKERKKLWKSTRAGDGPRERRDRAILALLFDLGLRRAEVTGLDRADVEAGLGAVLVLGKGRRERERLTLPEGTRRALAEWIEARGDHPGALFHRMDRGARGALDRITGRGVLKLTNRLGARAKLDRPLRPHGLRHAAITAALDSGSDVRAVRKFSRHAKIETVIKYDDAREDAAGRIAASVSRERK